MSIEPVRRSPEDELRKILASERWRIKKSQLQKVQELGSGSFAIVDLCWLSQGSNKQLVAVKLYRPQVLCNEAALKLLCGEIATLAQVKHRHIVRILGLGCEEGQEHHLATSKLFLVQEYLPGGSLRKLVTEQSLDWRMHGICTRDMLGWSLQLAQSVAYMHSLNPPILHRDCKLENVMLTMSPSKKWGGVDVGHMSPVDAADGGAKTSSAEVRLIDFGLAITLPDATELAQAISIHGASSYLDLMKLENDKKSSPNIRKKSELGAKKKSGSGFSGGMFFMKKRHDGSVGGAGSAHSRSSLMTEHLNVSKHGGGGLYDVSGASRTGSEASNPPPAETYSGPIHVPQQQQLPPLPLYHYGPPGAVESVRNGNEALEAQVASVVTGLEKQLSKVAMEASVHSVGRPAHLTGMTGSLMYMAPEVFKGLDYGTKADVFSFGICLWELVHRRLVFSMIFERNFGAEDERIQKEIFLYAASVSTGYRPPINDAMVPASLAGLIGDCWAQNPSDRPTMKMVVDRLHSILRVEDLVAIDAGPGGQGCGCVIS